MAEKKSKAATVLSYTDGQKAAIEAFQAHAGTPCTAEELGVPGVVIVGLMQKAEKVANGSLSNPDNLPVLNISKDKKTIEVTVEKPVTVYWIDKESK